MEIRKLKIIKYFLLNKTVRLKRKKKLFTKKLVNTVGTLTDKIKQRIEKIPDYEKHFGSKGKSKPDLNSLTNKQKLDEDKVKSIGKLIEYINTNISDWKNKLSFGQKYQTLKRLKLLKDMISATKSVKKIDDTVRDKYQKQNTANSKQYKLLLK